MPTYTGMTPGLLGLAFVNIYPVQKAAPYVGIPQQFCKNI